MIVSACKDLTQRIGGVYRVRYYLVTVRTGYPPGGPLAIGEASTVQLKGIWGETSRLLNYTKFTF